MAAAPSARRAWWARVLGALIMITVFGPASLYCATSPTPGGPQVRASMVALVDNFAKDRSLDTNLWIVDGPEMQVTEANIMGGMLWYYPNVGFFSSSFNFSPLRGLEIPSIVKSQQSAGLQCATSFAPPFAISTDVMVPSAGNSAFFLVLSNSPGNQGVLVIGSQDSYHKLNGVHYVYPGPNGKQLRQTLFPSFLPNTWYRFSFAVNRLGGAMLRVSHMGVAVGKTEVQVGSGPLWFAFGQFAVPDSAPVSWRSVRIFSGSAAPGIVGGFPTGGETSIVESPVDTQTTAKLEQAARQAPQVEQKQLEEWMKKAAASGMSPAQLAQIQQMEEQAIRQSGQFAVQSVPHEFQSSMQLPRGGSLYLYGAASDGRAAMVDFEAMSPGAWIRGPGGGYASGEMASSASNTARAVLSGSAGGYTIGGVSVSGFGTWHASYGSTSVNAASDTFVISRTSLVVVMGVAAGSQTVTLSGVPGLATDASLPGMTIAHTYLPPGSYTLVEHSQPLAGDENPGASSHAVGVYVFDGGGR